MSFAEKLKKLMHGLNLSQTEMSRLLGIGNSSISQYLAGKNEPSKARRREMAKGLGVQEDYFEEFLPTVKVSCINLPVSLVAKLMGKSIPFIQKGLQDGVFPWGYAVKMGKWSYFISSVKFTEHTGIEVPINWKEEVYETVE